jgi:hypothetical protein
LSSVPEAAPPGYGESPRSAGGVVRAVAIVLVASIVLAVFGYVGGGLVYTKVRLDGADSAYNSAVADQKAVAQLINSLKGSSTPAAPTTFSEAHLQQDWAVIVKFVTDSESARMQIDLDDQTLVDAAAGLDEDRWLTVLSRSTVDAASRRVALERKVLADARSIVSDFVLIGNFFHSFVDIEFDFVAISTSAKAGDLNAVASEIAKVRADTAKGISLDKSPGLPPEVDELMRLIQVIDGDFSNLLNAEISKNASAVGAAEKAGRADTAKLQVLDHSMVVQEMQAFYAPMIDTYNADVAKAGAA